MNQQLFINNFAATLAAPATNTATTLSLYPTGIGSLLPVLSDDDYVLLTLTQSGAESSWETVKVTAVNGDSVTVVRAVEGLAQAWNMGDKAEVRIPASYLNLLSTLIPATIPFQTQIPFGRYQTYMPSQTVTGPLTFTPYGTLLEGATCNVGLIADGVNQPDFSAFERHSSDLGYKNTASTLNIVKFFRLLGRNFYAVSQGNSQVIPTFTMDFSNSNNSGLLAALF